MQLWYYVLSLVMLIPRRLTDHLRQLSQYFPIISLTGPRQAGKTTLLSQLFPGYRYVTLEQLDVREAALADTAGFLEKYDDKVIFDEAQLAPPLFNYLQGEVDRRRTPGRFVLSGSQNFLLHRNITQSLAGRVGIARLFPLDLLELGAVDRLPPTFTEAIVNGFYPGQHTTGTPPRYFYPSYVSSYLERDVQDLINAGKLRDFLTFLRICAHFSGQLLNKDRMATMVGVTSKTINSWLSILEMSYIVFFLRPYFKDYGKRLIKSPKLYFYDTGLLCHLLQLKSTEDVERFENKGALFENLVIAERTKALQHAGEEPPQYFFRDSNGLEADLLEGGTISTRLFEIKSSTTYREKFSKSIRNIGELGSLPVDLNVIYGGSEAGTQNGVRLVPWFQAGRV